MKTHRPSCWIFTRARNFGDRLFSQMPTYRPSGWLTPLMPMVPRGMLDNKTAPEVVKFLQEARFQPLGTLAAMTLDMCKEFTAESFTHRMKYYTWLWATSPWRHRGRATIQGHWNRGDEGSQGSFDLIIGSCQQQAQMVLLGKNPRVIVVLVGLQSSEPGCFRSHCASLQAKRRAAVARPRLTVDWRACFPEQKAVPKKMKLIQRR